MAPWFSTAAVAACTATLGGVGWWRRPAVSTNPSAAAETFASDDMSEQEIFTHTTGFESLDNDKSSAFEDSSLFYLDHQQSDSVDRADVTSSVLGESWQLLDELSSALFSSEALLVSLLFDAVFLFWALRSCCKRQRIFGPKPTSSNLNMRVPLANPRLDPPQGDLEPLSWEVGEFDGTTRPRGPRPSPQIEVRPDGDEHMADVAFEAEFLGQTSLGPRTSSPVSQPNVDAGHELVSLDDAGEDASELTPSTQGAQHAVTPTGTSSLASRWRRASAPGGSLPRDTSAAESRSLSAVSSPGGYGGAGDASSEQSRAEMAVGAVTPPSPALPEDVSPGKDLAQYLPGQVLSSPTPLGGSRRYRRSRPPPPETPVF